MTTSRLMQIAVDYAATVQDCGGDYPFRKGPRTNWTALQWLMDAGYMDRVENGPKFARMALTRAGAEWLTTQEPS